MAGPIDDLQMRVLTLERLNQRILARLSSIEARLGQDESLLNKVAAGSPQQPGGGGMSGWGTISTTITAGSSGNVTITSGPLNTQVISMKNNYANSITASGTKVVWWSLDSSSGIFYVVTADC